ncbi:trypsin-like peptidase domain-containing protein [Coleofasciculus sp. FACHB-1120]|uniref:S1C family serine protease n=1 Tax=Coleofasciculus sp. FACHB-1120 TaxID=2692783 RepID=UPI001681C6DA|nr:trypsin-like peptidase domain-containing protein [Coleofasciculus sp. FACHB-1120]MBD2743899.1 trypsin-like peptidase domain-containing protein [Coleofasciculus sp. FACHB-1120]
MATATLENTGASAEIALELSQIAEQLRRSTLQVRSSRGSGGSGVIWNSQGLIITNAHVAPSDRAIVELWDGRVMEAIRTDIDSRQDLAALQVEATDLPAVTVGDSETLRVGELVLAVGNPLGLVGALTKGIIHATNATEDFSTQRWVKADIRLAPGNSGGLLADAQGRAIAINTMIADGLALAIPSNRVERFLKRDRSLSLGVTLRPVLLRLENQRVLGLLVLEVAPGSLAASVSLQIGDVLIGVDGEYFQTPDDLPSILKDAEPGKPLALEFLRSGRRCYAIASGERDSAEPTFPEVKLA